MKKNIDLLYVYPTEFKNVQSHGMQVLHTCNELQKSNFDVTLISYGDIYKFANYHNIPVHFSVKQTPIRVGNKYLDRFTYYTFSFVNSLSSDVVFTRDTWYLKYLSTSPIDLSPPVLFECHECLSQAGRFASEEERLRLLEADALITISDGVKQDIEALGTDVKVDQVVPDAASRDLIPDKSVSDLRDEYGIDQDEVVLVYTGNLKLWKNELRLMLNGYCQLRKDFDNVRLIIAGGNEENNTQLQSYAKDVGLSDDEVLFLGHVPHQTACELQYLSDVGIVPLNADELWSRKYTSPLKLYEYLVNGLSVVASDVPTIKNTLSDNANVFLYSSGNKTSFVDACKTAITEPYIDGEAYTYRDRASELRDIIKMIHQH